MSGWNNRVVRKKHIISTHGIEYVEYTYGIHEAFYDKLGKVVAITENPIEPFGNTITDCRRSWVMMAEAFGKPVLDSDNIPEEGHDVNDRLVDTSSLQDEIDEANEDTEENRLIAKEFQESIGRFDRVSYQEEQEIERLASEVDHQSNFSTFDILKDLVNAIFEDYDKYRKSQKNEE